MSAPAHLPSLTDAGAWLNSGPLDPARLRGSVVLVDFWTLTCINWLRTEPWIRAWARAYRDDGLVVVGVHTPEFSFEHEVALVRRAVEERRIDYPVAVDNDYVIWNAFDNHYWPALYFVDRDGLLRDAHFGEGRYEQSERLLQELLGVDREPVRVDAGGVEAQADWDHLRSPETYLGYARGERFASPENPAPDRPGTYSAPEALPVNRWALAGDWNVESEKVRLVAGAGSVTYRFDARDVHLVLSAGAGPPVPFQVRLDGRAPGASAGIDVDADGWGMLEEGRLYQLVRAREPVHERTLEITFDRPGAGAYVFTFG